MSTENIKHGPAVADPALGEYGRLKAKLEDMENPYSGRPLFDGPWPVVAAIAAGATAFGIGTAVYVQTSSFATGLLTLVVVSFIASFVVWKFLTTWRKEQVRRQIDQWCKQHPNVNVTKQ